MNWLMLMILGCQDFPPQGYNGAVEMDDGASTQVPTAQVSWTDEGIQLTITNNNGLNFTRFGIAQNDDDCLNNEAAGIGLGCWTGEDCLNGDVGETAQDLNVCHTYGTLSGPLLLTYSTEGITRSIVEGEVVANSGQSTAFPDSSFEFLVTYYLYEAVNGNCWRWGYNTEYYAGQNCNIAN